MKSQRLYNGGIQPGQVATDEAASKLDKQLRAVRDQLTADLQDKYPLLTCQKKLTPQQIPGGIGACSPDGGAWFYDGQLIVVAEAKKQQDHGNAIERWFKNNYICRLINPNVSYLTFCVGEGAYIGGVIHKALSVAHSQGVNTLIPGYNSVFYEILGHEYHYILNTIREAIEERILHAEG